ncbi:MAG TPA: DUF6134 family protein [Alphaproteobacteria bacterium]
MRRSVALLISALCLGAVGVQPVPAAAAAPLTLEYRVKHPTYGDIGSYTNIIERSGDSVRVQTVVRIAVKVFGATLYREDADRTEHWKDGRLVYFHGITNKDGKRLEVTGEASGDRFAITGPEGTYLAPADVQPPNPLSPDCLRADTMMSSVSGKVYPAQVRDNGEETVLVAGQSRRAHKYGIDTDRQHWVWFDDQGVPVMLESIERGDHVRLTLTRYPETINVAAAPAR